MLLLAGPGVLISTFCLGSALKVFYLFFLENCFFFFFVIILAIFSLQLIFPYEWNWTTSLLLGGLLSATDPVAVVALLKELGASKKLSTIIEGESLMNDGYFTYLEIYSLIFLFYAV